jgi:hypothetical protein
MLAFNLQFSRLDDVIHFYLRPLTLPHPFWEMEEKSTGFVEFLYVGEGGRPTPLAGIRAPGLLISSGQIPRCH